MPERIGVLGGAFDPPHIGHLLLGETAREQMALDLVLYLPTGAPPHKNSRNITAAEHRLAMTQVATADHEHFMVSAVDIERPPPHYTATLLPYLAERYPRAEFVLIIGGDSLRDLPQWHAPRLVLEQWQLAVLPRPDFPVAWEPLEAEVPGVRRKTTMLDGPSVALSSTQLRRWVAAGRSLRYCLPPALAAYIQANGLYQPAA